MTGAPTGGSAAEAVRSLEVRWIFPGGLPAAMARWFGRFPAVTESRRDAYLLDPDLRGLSVKIRDGAALEVKAYLGSQGILEVAGRARGRLQSWRKWSFPFRPSGPGSDPPAGWRLVGKRRRISRFCLAGHRAVTAGQAVTAGLAPSAGPGCAAELTEIWLGGQPWWSLGFEATGPAGLLRGELDAAAAMVLAEVPPAGAELGLGDSRSYSEWLSGER